ncbi:MAG: response regulator [Spirochaetaceae bacterium]|jgi:PAS domain S-box-containing protein|nr:response regulator [Spirochaetaceae bacterium]
MSPDNLEKEYHQLTRQFKKLERDYRALSVMHEQTERLRNANEVAKELSNFYNRLLLKNTPTITFMLDLELRFVLGSEKTVAFLGYSDMREMVDVPFSTLFASTMPEAWIGKTGSQCREVIGTNQSAGYEEKVTLLDGADIVFQVTITPAEERDGVCRGVVVVMNDVSELFGAREEAERASMAKGAFLANMSHEMRTPMNAIIGMTTIAKSSPDPEKKDYCLDKIEDASTHLLGVINDILDMSKIEANKLELAPVNFNFEKMLQKTVNVINFRVEEKHQNFAVRIDETIPYTLFGDDQRLAQVIANLLSNAIKFTPEYGSVRLSARLLGKEDGLCTLRIEVTDSGIGISENQRSRLFSSFEQADSGTSRKFGGTGLGLAISKRIVEMMGGDIRIESELGKGASFIFTVQLKEGEQKAGSLLKEGVNWNTMRILAVDDAPEILEHFEIIARQLGVNCDLASGGEEATALIRQNGPYDIYFVDWKMPGMDGMEFTRRIKAGNADKSVIIMISATEWSLIADDAKTAGVDKFLPKPLFPSSIAECLNECLGTDTPPVSRDERPDDGMDRFEGYRIILAEDVEINREIVLALLEPAALTIDCAENGEEAVSMFCAAPEKYDMIFMDLQMPKMDGYEATRLIRAFEKERRKKMATELPRKTPKEIPIIAMTANVFREDIEKCLQTGMDDHIGKPLDLNDVLQKLRAYLPKKRLP